MKTRIKAGSSHSGLFLIELILAIGFFSVASAVCVQLFVRAHLISTESRALSHASLCAQSAAESFKAAEGNPEQTAALLGATPLADRLTVFYNAQWEPIPIGDCADAAYVLTLEPHATVHLATAEIRVSKSDIAASSTADDSGLIYRLRAEAFLPESPGDFSSPR